MSQARESRPGVVSQAALEAFDGATEIVVEMGDGAQRPRCLRCGHPLSTCRSVARAYGPKCWRRTAVGMLDARRDAVGRLLAAVARRVAVAGPAWLAELDDQLCDVRDRLDDAAVRS